MMEIQFTKGNNELVHSLLYCIIILSTPFRIQITLCSCKPKNDKLTIINHIQQPPPNSNPLNPLLIKQVQYIYSTKNSCSIISTIWTSTPSLINTTLTLICLLNVLPKTVKAMLFKYLSHCFFFLTPTS